jgi:hypothetical protein
VIGLVHRLGPSGVGIALKHETAGEDDREGGSPESLLPRGSKPPAVARAGKARHDVEEADECGGVA